MRMLARGLTAAVTLLASLAALPAATAQATHPKAQPLRSALAPLHRNSQAVPGQYIVTLDNGADPSAFAKQFGVSPMFHYTKVFSGFASKFTAAQLATVRRTPGVAAVEENATVTADGLGPTTGVHPGSRERRAAAASWGLDRIDQRNLPLDHQFTVDGTGQGATAYVLDTGIDFGHSEFGGRAVPGYDAIGDGRNGQDCEGHGTHVAGTIGGKTYGVARQAKLVSVRVLDCQGQGTLAGIIAGMDWVAQHAQQPAVANASLGGSYSPALNDAADALSDSGVLPVVAAGNDSADACTVSPASAPRVLTIGASNASDQEAGFSNSGSCVSMFAPGTAIVSAKLGGGSVAMDGTSMASPHAAGTALLYKSEHPDADAMAVADALTASATQNVLKVNGGSPDLLLYTGGL
ncbi:S8 family peptidase [Actinacidiphila acidipaludis]|uniref:S8 family peptidase n=1 Tax=Actinacidiphila acidipaludis TaxID=2873382 RepID=A0ABS7Q338_9ACTN|nr:S8 family peptidase [Streptomyces acidipaludis]MBY8877554.1 S8 family peptidase [Streptomyces acidipaludis]